MAPNLEADLSRRWLSTLMDQRMGAGQYKQAIWYLEDEWEDAGVISRSCSMSRKAIIWMLLSRGSILLSILILTSCAIWPDSYLKSAVNHSTQDTVAKYFGPPHLSRELSTGEEVWLYGFSNSIGSIGCTSYILTFDREKILRDWQWQPSCPQSFRP